MAEQISKEANRRRSRCKVKVFGLIDVEAAALRALLENTLQTPILRINATGDTLYEFVVEVENAEQKRILLAQNGKAIRNHGFLMTLPVCDTPSYRECLQIILDRVEQDEELGDTHRPGGPQRAYVVQIPKAPPKTWCNLEMKKSTERRAPLQLQSDPPVSPRPQAPLRGVSGVTPQRSTECEVRPLEPYYPFRSALPRPGKYRAPQSPRQN